MGGYKYRAPRRPAVALVITDEEEARIEPELKHIRGPRVTDEMVGIPPEPGSGRPGPAQCGTLGGYSAHRRYGEPPCDECKAAAAAHKAANRQSRAKDNMIWEDLAA